MLNDIKDTVEANVVGLLDNSKQFSSDQDAVGWHKTDNILEVNRIVSDLDILDIIEMHRGLWQIKESFKIIEFLLKARPVFVHLQDSIQAHFISCFISLLLLRLLERKTENSITIQKLVSSLRKANLVLLSDGNNMSLIVMLVFLK